MCPRADLEGGNPSYFCRDRAPDCVWAVFFFLKSVCAPPLLKITGSAPVVDAALLC